MTTLDIAGLCEKLRNGAVAIDIDGTPAQAGPYPDELREIADTLERQAAEIERLRDSAAKTFADVMFLRKDHLGQSEQFYAEEVSSLCRRALAALTGEDAAGSPTSQNTEPGLAFSDAGEL
jgi:hypothetical protein